MRVYIYIGSNIRTMRLTYPTALVLQALLDGYHHGFDVMEATGLPSGTVYPILRRLDAEGCVRSRWEKEGLASPTAPAAPLLRTDRRLQDIAPRRQERAQAPWRRPASGSCAVESEG